jgi:hypothetical protein
MPSSIAPAGRGLGAGDPFTLTRPERVVPPGMETWQR